MSLKLNQIHNLAINCKTELELSIWLEAHRSTINTKLAGPHTLLPMYYLTPSKSSGKMQDKHGKWYQPKL